MRRPLSLGLIGLGVVCLLWYGAETLRTAAFQRQQESELSHRLAVRPPITGTIRRLEYQDLVGRLEIPRLHLSVAIIEGDDDPTLKKAAGHLPDTALPWESGNTAIAAHRDTFFRPLRNIRPGDEIRLVTVRGTFVYRVRDTRVTKPDDVAVLAPMSRPSLTLLTCYPFYYVGSAPNRYVVRADRVTPPVKARITPSTVRSAIR